MSPVGCWSTRTPLPAIQLYTANSEAVLLEILKPSNVKRQSFSEKTSMASRRLFRQLFDKESSTYTYLLADMVAREAILIDPVIEQVGREPS